MIQDVEGDVGVALDADAVSQAALIRNGSITAADLLDAAIDRIEKINPAVKAVIHLDTERAHRRLKELDDSMAFAGVPLLYKDLGSCEEGMPLTMGCAALRGAGYTAEKDGPFARRLKALGLVGVGKTNTCEFGIQPTTQPTSWGPTANPWDTTLSSGGSSGGSAAAVATGMVAVAHGTDSAGSLRVPATWCGVKALKPSRGAIPLGAEVDRNRTEFLLARSIRDLQAVFAATAGADPDDLYGSPRPPTFVPEAATARRIGVQTSLPGIQVDEEVVATVRRAAGLLIELGYEVVEAELPLSDTAAAAAGLVYTRSLLRSNLVDLAGMIGRQLRDGDVEPYTLALAFSGPTPTGEELFSAMKTIQRHAVQIVDSWSDQRLDVLLTPAVPVLPLPLADLEPPADDPFSIRSRFAQLWSFARPFNQTGQPAVALPVERSPSGLPVGVQLVSARGQDVMLMRVAAELEAAAALPTIWPGAMMGRA